MLNERASARMLIVMVEIGGLSIVNNSEVGFDPVLETSIRLTEFYTLLTEIEIC